MVSASRSRREMADGNLEMYSALQNLRKKFEEQSSTLISDSKVRLFRISLIFLVYVDFVSQKFCFIFLAIFVSFILN